MAENDGAALLKFQVKDTTDTFIDRYMTTVCQI